VKGGFGQSKLVRSILELLSQGITPEKIAWTLSVGLALGVFPLLGTTTLLCAVAALIWRLNMPLIQLVNYLIYPAQVILLLPFWRAGAWVFGSKVPFNSISEMVTQVRHDPWESFLQWGWTALEGVGVWGLASAIVVPVLYFVLLRLIRRSMKGSHV
jgi:uncharacterized protein (DUF2062 family)